MANEDAANAQGVPVAERLEEFLIQLETAASNFLCKRSGFDFGIGNIPQPPVRPRSITSVTSWLITGFRAWLDSGFALKQKQRTQNNGGQRHALHGRENAADEDISAIEL